MFESLSETLASVCEQISNPKAYQQRIKNELDKACENALKKAEESERNHFGSLKAVLNGIICGLKKRIL